MGPPLGSQNTPSPTLPGAGISGTPTQATPQSFSNQPYQPFGYGRYNPAPTQRPTSSQFPPTTRPDFDSVPTGAGRGIPGVPVRSADVPVSAYGPGTPRLIRNQPSMQQNRRSSLSSIGQVGGTGFGRGRQSQSVDISNTVSTPWGLGVRANYTSPSPVNQNNLTSNSMTPSNAGAPTSTYDPRDFLFPVDDRTVPVGDAERRNYVAALTAAILSGVAEDTEEWRTFLADLQQRDPLAVQNLAIELEGRSYILYTDLNPTQAIVTRFLRTRQMTFLTRIGQINAVLMVDFPSLL